MDAFERLYQLHAGRVYALCLRLAGEPVEARELVQDTFVHAWEALPRFRGESSLTTWLHRIAVNVLLERRRGDRRRAARVTLVEDEDDVERAPGAEGFVAPTDVATAIDLERAIAALPPGVRRAFVLHEVEGYTHEEVAGMTGLATGTLAGAAPSGATTVDQGTEPMNEHTNLRRAARRADGRAPARGRAAPRAVERDPRRARGARRRTHGDGTAGVSPRRRC